MFGAWQKSQSWQNDLLLSRFRKAYSSQRSGARPFLDNNQERQSFHSRIQEGLAGSCCRGWHSNKVLPFLWNPADWSVLMSDKKSNSGTSNECETVSTF